MHRLEALKIAKIAYIDINSIYEKWNSGIINYLPIDFGWNHVIKVGEHLFQEYELCESNED